MAEYDVLKLPGYGVYVNYIDEKLWVSKMNFKGHPTMDKDGCIEWTELEDPDNKTFLDLINDHYKTKFTLSDYGKYMSISELIWESKNLREGYNQNG